MSFNEESKEIYQQYRQDLLKRQLSNSENYDRAILTLSTTILGLTLTFIRNVIPLESSIRINLLIAAWFFLLVTIVVTILSFHLSQAGIDVQIDYAEKYYLQNQNEYLTKKNFPAILTEWAGYLSAAAFVAAMILLVTFVSLNISHLNYSVLKEDSEVTSKIMNDSFPSNKVGPKQQKSSSQTHGAKIPPMQPVSKPPIPPSQTGAGGNGSGSNKPSNTGNASSKSSSSH